MRKKAKIAIWIIGILVCIIFSGLVFVAAIGPETSVVPGSRIKPWHRSTIERICGLAPDERIQRFYSSAFIDVENDGNLFTDRGVYSYEKSEAGKTVCMSARYEDIDDMTIAYKTSYLEDSEITIKVASGDDFMLLVSNEKGLDRTFFEEMKALWRQRKPER
jgi:hypothetical protein